VAVTENATAAFERVLVKRTSRGVVADGVQIEQCLGPVDDRGGSVAIAQVFPVASNATSSAGPRPSANARTPSGAVANLPAWITSPPYQIATRANSRCTFSPIPRRSVCVCIALLP